MIKAWIQTWIESIILKRLCVNAALFFASYLAAHLPAFSGKLALWGIDLQIQVHPEKLANVLNIGIFLVFNEIKHVLQEKLPQIGKYV